MSKPQYSQLPIFLVQPLRKHQYRETIVYAETEQEARIASAALAKNSKNKSSSIDAISPETVYLNNGMSICIAIHPDIIKVENNLEYAQVKYNEVLYDLKKNVAELVIAENVL